MIVLIDLFGTLVDEDSDRRAHELIAKRIATQHGFPEAWTTLLQMYREALSLYEDSNRALYEAYRRFVNVNGLEPLYTLEELTWLHVWSHIEESKLYSDAIPFLKRVSTRHRVVVVSDTIEDVARGIIRYHGLQQYIHAVIATHSYGLSKPDPKILSVVRSVLGMEIDSVVVIGDSVRDYELAKNIGARFVAVARDRDREERFRSLGVEVVSSLEEIEL